MRHSVFLAITISRITVQCFSDYSRQREWSCASSLQAPPTSQRGSLTQTSSSPRSGHIVQTLMYMLRVSLHHQTQVYLFYLTERMIIGDFVLSAYSWCLICYLSQRELLFRLRSLSSFPPHSSFPPYGLGRGQEAPVRYRRSHPIAAERRDASPHTPLR